LIQFSILAVLLATLLLFLQWNEISDSDKFNAKRRGENSLHAEDDEDFGGLFDTEREFDVNEILKEIHGNSNAANSTEDDWETVFNEKAKHQAEKEDNKENQGKRKIAAGENRDHVDNRQLKQVLNDSQTPNITTTTSARTSGGVNTLSTSPPAPVANDKRAQLQKNVTETHDRDSYAGGYIQVSPTWKTFTWRKDMLGSLNVHIWQAWCGSTIHDLRRNKFFPLYPDVRLTIKKFFVRHWESDYGQRIFGYIHPPASGKYTFAISSDDSSELWLSSDENPSNVKLIAWVGNRTLLSGIFKTKIAQFTKYKTQLSRPVFLHKGQKYFIEVLHKQASLEDHVLVGWKIPGLSHFRHLSGDSISLFIDDEKAPKDVTVYAQFIPQDLPSHSHYRTSTIRLNRNIFKFGSDDLRDKAHSAKFADESDLVNLFPSCPYSPSYLVDFKLRRYDGVKLIHDTSVYPDDNTYLTHMKPYDSCGLRTLKDSHGNSLASESPHSKRNQGLYENGSITVFSSGKVFLPLSFAKSAIEREKAEEQLLEMQMDIRDIKKRSQEVEDPARSPKTALPAMVSHSLPEKDKENIFEMRKKAKRKTVAPVIRTKRNISTADQKNSHNKDNMINKRQKMREVVRVDSKGKTTSESKMGVQRSSRVQNSRDSAKDQSRAIAVGTRRKLLSYNADSRTSSRNKETEEFKARISYYPGNSFNSNSQRRTNSSFGNSQQYRGRIQFLPIDKQDDLLTRMNAAREFVRKMADAVQKYNYRVNARALAEAVYTKFGVKLKIPNIIRVPEHNEWIFHQNSTKCASDGNLLLNTEVAVSAVNRYLRALKKATNSKYSLKEILNVEENHDVLKGDRYLIDLVLNVKGKNSSVRLSQYVYQKMGSTEFCLPQGFALNQHATVHIIIPVKNQGKWVQHFIDNMVELYLETADPHVNVIIVDFSSTDIDVVAALKQSQLKRYQVRKLRGAFQRAYGIQAGAALVKNPQDIIFMCDLHLQIPSNIVDIIRKHCVPGKMAFAPIVARLHCGFSPSIPFGFWELQGYGLFAIYKSDFTRVGGMNYEEFRTNWGGEDWELLDRVLLAKMEVERLRVAKFYHYYHSKKGMWGTRSMFSAYDRDMFGRFDDDTDIIPLYNETMEKEKEKRFLHIRKDYID